MAWALGESLIFPEGIPDPWTPCDSFARLMKCVQCPITPFVQNKTITLTINEIYRSIQGESTWAGLPCVFVRLTFCDLRCTYCDTAYAFYAGTKMTFAGNRSEGAGF